MSKIETKLLQPPLDLDTRAAVTELWARNDVIIPDPDQRLAEVRGAALVDGDIVGISTAGLVTDSLTQQRFLTLRAVTDAAYRHQMVALLLVYEVGQALHRRYLEGHRGTEVGAILQYENPTIIGDEHPLQDDRENNPYDPVHTFMAGFCRVGFDSNNALCCLMYYPGIDIVPPVKHPTAASSLPESTAPAAENYDCEVRLPGDVFSTADEVQLQALWTTEGVFTDSTAMEERLPFVRCLVRHNDELVGSASVINEPFPEWRSRIQRIRVFLAADHRHRDLEAEVIRVVFAAYEAQFRHSQIYSSPPGMCYWVGADNIKGSELKAVQPINNFWCAGFNGQGAMRRLHWFRGANQGLVAAAANSHLA